MSLHLSVRLLGVALAGSTVVAPTACGAPVDEPSSTGAASPERTRQLRSRPHA
jgi:hypothetical protein